MNPILRLRAKKILIPLALVSFLAVEFVSVVAFAQIQPASTQINSVQMLRALLQAVSARPAVFTSARRVKVPDQDRVAQVAQAIARDIEQVLRSPNVTETLRVEKDGMLSAARTVVSTSFIAQELTRIFSPKTAPTKRTSVLDGVVGVASAADVPTDVEIKEAEAKVKDVAAKVNAAKRRVNGAKANLREAEQTEDKGMIAKEKAELDKAEANLAAARVELDKAKADLGAKKMKKSIANSVASCTYSPKLSYGNVKWYIAQPMVNLLLLRAGNAIGNPYDPETGQFARPFPVGRYGNLSEEEVVESLKAEGAMGMFEAQFLLELAQRAKAFNSQNDFLREMFDEELGTWKVLGKTIRGRLEKEGILNTGGLVDKIDEFLGIQHALLYEDLVELKKPVDNAKNAIDAEVQKLTAVLRAAEGKLGRKLGDIGADSAEAKAQLDTALKAYLNCDRTDVIPLDNLLIFLRAQIYNKIFDAIKNAMLDTVRGGLIDGTGVVVPGRSENPNGTVSVHTAFDIAIKGDNLAVEGLQKASDAAIRAAYPGFLEGFIVGLPEGASARLTLRFSILLLRNLQGFSSDLSMTLSKAFDKATIDFGNEWGIISESPKIKTLYDPLKAQGLMFSIDEFVRRFKEIVAGIEGLSKTGLKAQYCKVKALVDEREKSKEEAMKNIEASQPKPTVPRGGDCRNINGWKCLRGDDGLWYLYYNNRDTDGRDVFSYNNLDSSINDNYNAMDPSTYPWCVQQWFCSSFTEDTSSNAMFENGPVLTCLEGWGCKNPGLYEVHP